MDIIHFTVHQSLKIHKLAPHPIGYSKLEPPATSNFIIMSVENYF